MLAGRKTRVEQAEEMASSRKSSDSVFSDFYVVDAHVMSPQVETTQAEAKT